MITLTSPSTEVCSQVLSKDSGHRSFPNVVDFSGPKGRVFSDSSLFFHGDYLHSSVLCRNRSSCEERLRVGPKGSGGESSDRCILISKGGKTMHLEVCEVVPRTQTTVLRLVGTLRSGRSSPGVSMSSRDDVPRRVSLETLTSDVPESHPCR